MQMTRRCTKCREMKSNDCFPKGHNRCTVCRDKYMSEWAAKNRDKINTNQRIYHQTLAGRASMMINAARKRSKEKNQIITLTIEDVIKGISSGYCSKTLFPFDLSIREDRGNNYKINPFAPSLDKIDPSGIYEKSNVQYVCAWYNLAKGQMTEEDLNMFCRRVASLNP